MLLPPPPPPLLLGLLGLLTIRLAHGACQRVSHSEHTGCRAQRRDSVAHLARAPSLHCYTHALHPLGTQDQGIGRLPNT